MFVVWTMILALLPVALPGAQSSPNMLGRWILDGQVTSAPDIPKALSVRQSLVRTMERGPMKPFFRDLTIAREFESGTRTETYQIGVAGERLPPATGGATPSPSSDHDFVQWDRHGLVIESQHYSASGNASDVMARRREVWALDPDGRLKLTVTTRISADAPKTAAYRYRRESK
jgi:hypothetical protein